MIMRHLPPFLVLFALASTAVATAADLDRHDQACKTNDHVLRHQSFDRQGGNTIAEAVVIEAVPYYDTGATCDNTNDYDAMCPYDGSLSPDVVYSFTPEMDMPLNVDLCQSLYDTKVYIYDSDMNLVACNDDAGCGITGWQSKVENVPLYGGVTYYIFVDGYGGDCGEYVLDIVLYEPCDLECDGMAEGEPPLVPNYEDDYNGGCGSPTGEAWQILTANKEGTLDFCGVTGWYDYDGLQFRDSDWLMAVVGETGLVEIEITGEFAFEFVILVNSDCTTLEILEVVMVDPCESTSTVYEADPGELLCMVALPATWDDPLEWDYILSFTGLEEGIVAVENASFGSVKALYR